MLMENCHSDKQSNVFMPQRHANPTSTSVHNFRATNQYFSQINSCQKPTVGIVPSCLGVSSFTCLNPTFGVPIDLPDTGKENVATRKRFLIFDQSGDCTRLIFRSLHPPFWKAKSVEQQIQYECQLDRHTSTHCQCCYPTHRSAETGVSDGSGMPEDSHDIDALLYSDYEHDEEEPLNGCFPEKASESNEEVASSDFPSKRRRLNEDTNMLLANSTSSLVAPRLEFSCHDHIGEETICVKGDTGDASSEASLSKSASCGSHYKRKRTRDRILKTVGMLRRIIPGGNEKDAAMVLDKAIQYLRSFKLKAEVPGTLQ